MIGAESVIRELSSGRVGPAPLRAQQLPYIHTRTDRNGWGKRPGEKDQLLMEDADRHAVFRREFWEQHKEPPSPVEVSQALSAKNWIMLVDDDAERRALQAWVRAMAGGRSFARWCKNVEHIAVMTGRRRKNRAVEKILAQLDGKHHLHDENDVLGVLPVTPEFDDISDTLTGVASGCETGLNSWASDDAFQPFIKCREVINDHIAIQTVDAPQSEFDWARRRNEVRRQREAKKRQKQAA
ncbi:hypothetical protein [Mesorhizobium amorphae]|uniref:hypothetical protein n=1 Tax=Mesorhizobium amorphae TaxID=71433 RepID=UPI001187296E|nr:hypothetical protein [Mesorhizobium amorphae]